MEQFLLFLVIAVVSWIFNRSKGTNQQEKQRTETQQRPRPQQQRPSTIEQTQPSVQQTTASKRENFPDFSKVRNLKDAAEILISKQQHLDHVEDKEVELRIEQLKKDEERYIQQAEKIQNKLTTKTTPPVLELEFNHNDVVKGIVMSEVLGPPRSRKPYRRNY